MIKKLHVCLIKKKHSFWDYLFALINQLEIVPTILEWFNVVLELEIFVDKILLIVFLEFGIELMLLLCQQFKLLVYVLEWVQLFQSLTLSRKLPVTLVIYSQLST